MSGALLQFDPVAHRYTLPSGEHIPNVTTILRVTGVSVDFEAKRMLSRESAAAIDLKREIGSALHQDAHAFDDDDLDWSTVDSRVEPYLRAWATYRTNSGLRPVTRERRLYHQALRYCGTMDGIFVAPDGHHVLIDIKTGDPTDAAGQYQTAAYALAYRTEYPDAPPILERCCVRLTPDRSVPYRVEPYDDWQDEACWRAFVTTYYCGQAARRSS